MLCGGAEGWLAGPAELERTGPFGTPSFPWLWEHQRRMKGMVGGHVDPLCKRPKRPIINTRLQLSSLGDISAYCRAARNQMGVI
jgi:hypothetical protein